MHGMETPRGRGRENLAGWTKPSGECVVEHHVKKSIAGRVIILVNVCKNGATNDPYIKFQAWTRLCRDILRGAVKPGRYTTIVKEGIYP